MEKEKGNYWYVFLVIGILIGAVLGYYANQKGWLGNEAVGRTPLQCFRVGMAYCEATEEDSKGYRACIDAYYNNCFGTSDSLFKK